MIIVSPLMWVAAYIQIVEHHNPGGWWLFAFGTLYFVVGMWDLIFD